MTRLLGMLLAALSVQFVLDGMRGFGLAGLTLSLPPLISEGDGQLRCPAFDLSGAAGRGDLRGISSRKTATAGPDRAARRDLGADLLGVIVGAVCGPISAPTSRRGSRWCAEAAGSRCRAPRRALLPDPAISTTWRCEFVVDTGATDMVLTREDARPGPGSTPRALTYTGIAGTANGERAHRARPDRSGLELEPGITDRNVPGTGECGRDGRLASGDELPGAASEPHRDRRATA